MKTRRLQRRYVVFPARRNFRGSQSATIGKKFRYSGEDGEIFVRLIVARSVVVETSGKVKICRDPDDDEILETAINGKVQYLATRDDDLKRDLDLIKMARRNGVRVVSVRQFLRRLSPPAGR